jgi:replicative DNA helicase
MSKKYNGTTRDLSYYLEKSDEAYSKRVELRKDGKIAGITSGLLSLDKMLTGWHDSELIIVAGRPGMGKTAVAVHFALSAAASGKNVLFYTLEMNGQTLTDRMILAKSSIDATDYREGVMRETDTDEIAAARKELSGYPIFIDDTPVITTGYIRSSAKRMKKDGMCDLVIIDYLQLIDMNTGVNKTFNREQQVAKTSRELKLLAKELDVPVICLSQLSRSVEGRQDKRPVMSDLRDSGSIEQDADVIIFVYRPDYYEKDNNNPPTNVAELKVAKQREGKTGIVPFKHNESLTKIADYSYNVNDKPFDKGGDFIPNYNQEQLPF